MASNRTDSAELMREENTTEISTPIPVSSVNFAVFGLTAVLSNVFILIILISDKKLLQRSALIAGVAVGHLITGLAIGAYGIFRVANRSILSTPVSAWFCVRAVFPVLLPFSFQFTSLMLCLVGVERMLAVTRPHWFRAQWTSRRAWMMLPAAFGISLLPIIYGIVQAWHTPPNSGTTTMLCGLPTVVGRGLVLWNFADTAICGTVAVILTLTAYHVCRRRVSKLPLLSGEMGRSKRQLQLTTAMLTVSALDLCLVVLPTMMAFFDESLRIPDVAWASISNTTTAVSASVTFIAHLVFNRGMRLAAVRLLRLRKCLCENPGSNKVHIMDLAGPRM